jgi:hypothetical protein
MLMLFDWFVAYCWYFAKDGFGLLVGSKYVKP